jgi:hypothetical protein
MSIARKAARWAQKICRDDRHGYNNTVGFRTGTPDYACSTLVAGAYRAAGLMIPANVYTAKMRVTFMRYGFRDVTSKVNLRTGEGLKVCDIVLAPGKHTEIVVRQFPKLKLAGARGNPRSGHAENGKAGDQTGREISVKKYYDDGWSVCLRYIDPEV